MRPAPEIRRTPPEPAMSAHPVAARVIGDDALLRCGQSVIATEIQALEALQLRIDGAFVAACRHILACPGRVICVGMGKSGHIARKIAATLASTGTPSFFVHAGEASHGDLGMITDQDLVLALSNSGESDELLAIAPLLKRQGNQLIAMTGRPFSSLAWRRPPARPSRWRWATRWRSRCSKPAASRRRISPARIRPATWAASCCCGFPMSCTRPTKCRWSTPTPHCRRRWWR
jgi:hypothetical protein